jgi:hypothetical protein
VPQNKDVKSQTEIIFRSAQFLLDTFSVLVYFVITQLQAAVFFLQSLLSVESNGWRRIHNLTR